MSVRHALGAALLVSFAVTSSATAAPVYMFGNVDPTTANLNSYQNALISGCYVGAFEDTADNFSGPFYGSKILWAHMVTFTPTLGGKTVGNVTIPLTSNAEVRMELFEVNGFTTSAASFTSLGSVTKVPETLHSKAWSSFDFTSQGIVLSTGKTYAVELQTANIGSHYGNKLNYWAGTFTGSSADVVVRNQLRVLADRQGTPLAPSTFGNLSLLNGFAPAIAVEAVVPEPTTLAAVGGVLTLVARRRR